MAESYSVTAVLSAQDKNFSSVFGSAEGAADSLAGKLKSGLGFGVLAGVGMKAVSAVTGAIGGMASGIVDAGMSFDSSMSQVAATMGKSVSEIQDLRAFAQDMGATTAFSASQAAEALNFMALAGYDSAKSMEMLPNVLNLAAAGGMELGRASDMVTDAQSALGLSTDETTAMVDQMAKTASKTNTSVEQLGDAILTIGATARSVKGGTTELNTLLGVLADNGIKGSEGGTHLRNILLSLQNPTDDAAKSLKKLGVNVYDSQGNMRSTVDIISDLKNGMSGMSQESKDAMISGIFNKTDLAAVNALLNTSEDRFDELEASIDDCQGAAEQMADTQLDNLSGDVTLFQSALEGLRISIFDNLDGPMRAAVKIATQGLTDLKGIVDNLGDAFGGAFSLSEITEALEKGGLSGALETILGDLGKLPEGFKVAGAAAGGLVGVNLVNSFLDSGIWKAGISSAGKFGKAMSGVSGAVSKKLSPLTGKIGQFTGALKTSAVDKFSAKFPKLSSAAGKAGSVFGKAASGITKTFGTMGSMLVKTMGFALKALMPAAMIGAVLAVLGVLYSKFGSQIDQILGMVAQKGPEIITNFVSGITSRLPALIASGAQLVSGILTAITANLPALVQGGVSLIQSLVMGVAASSSILMTKGVELIGTLVVSIASAVPQLITTGMTLLASLAQGVANNLPLVASYAMSAVMTFAQGIIENLPQILASAVSIVTSLITGIVNMLPVLISKGIQLVTYLAQSFISNLPLIIKTGVTVIAALVSGLVQALPMIVQGAVDLVKALVDTIINTDWIKVGGDIIDAISGGIKSGFSKVTDLVSGLFSEDTAAADGAAQQAAAAAESTAQAYLDSSSYISEAASQVGTDAQESLVSGLEGASSDVESIFSEMGTGGAHAFSDSLMEIDLSGIGTEAVGTVTTEFDTGLAELPGITDNAGSQVVTSLQETGKQAQTIAKQTTTNIIKAFRAGINQAKAAGKAVGSGYAGGIRGETANASSAGSAVKSSALNGMSGGYGSAYSHGSNIGQGLVDGMRSKIGAAWAAAEELAKAADKAIHARAQIGSPSKITIKYGGWIAEGLAVGIKSGENGVVKQAKKLVTTLYKQMQKSTKKLGGAKDAASTYLKAFKTGLQNKAKADLEYVESILKKYRDVSKSYNSAITALMKSYKTAYNKEVDKLITSVNTKLTNLANTYQTKYNNIINAQKDFRDTLRETSLYSADEYGNVALADFAAQNRAIKQYESNISKLKKLLPESMMDEILGMSRENGLAYTTELLKKSADEIRAYGKQYSVVMNTSSKVASSYYSGRLTALQKSYAADLKKIYADAQKDMDSIGKNVVQGLIDGMKSKKGALDATGKALASVVEQAFKKQLGIHSPSKVMTDAGEDTGQGVINGIENKVRAARAAMSKLIDATSPEAEIRQRSNNMSLSDEYDYRTEASYTIVVESVLDGKKVGEGTAKYVKQKNDATERREQRKRGKKK